MIYKINKKMILEESTKYIKKTGGFLNKMKRVAQASDLKTAGKARDDARRAGNDKEADNMNIIRRGLMTGNLKEAKDKIKENA